MKTVAFNNMTQELTGPVSPLTFVREIETLQNAKGSSTAVGDCLMVDFALATSSADFFPLRMIAPTTAGVGSSLGTGGATAGIFGIALDVAANGAPCRFQFYGHVQALIVGTPAVGVYVSPTNAAYGLTTTANLQHAFGLMKQVGVDATLKYVFWSGIFPLRSIVT